MLKNSWILKNFNQNEKHLQEIIQPFPNPPPSDKMLLRLWKKKFLRRYTEIYRHLLSKYFKNVVLGLQEMVQCKCFLWKQAEACLLEKFLKSERFLAVLREHIIFNVKWVEFRKMSDVSRAKLYGKMSDLFR